MSTEIAYTPEQVTTALMTLVANGGSASKTAEELLEGDFQVTAPTLRRWKNDTHAEQYRRLEENYGHELEQLAIQRARQIIEKAADKVEVLLERAGEAEGDLVPQALRAVADAQSKQGNLLMQLTGRPTNPRDNGSSDVVQLVMHMVDKGYLKLAPDVAQHVEGTAAEA